MKKNHMAGMAGSRMTLRWALCAARCLSVILILLLYMGSTVFAGPPYDVIHPFALTLRGNQVYRGSWTGWAYAAATGVLDPGPFNTVNGNSAFGPNAGGNGSVDTGPQNANPAWSESTAAYSAAVNGTGWVESKGWGALNAPSGGTWVYADSQSTLRLNRGTASRNGNVRWSPSWTTITAGTSHVGDPIDIGFLNLDDNTYQTSRLFDLEVNLNGPGTSTDENGNITISGRDGSFSLVMDSPYITSGIGTITLSFSGGLVTESDATGIYAGLLPGVGSGSDAISFHIGDGQGNVDIDFDYGPDNVNGFDADATFANSGSWSEVPEPSTLTLLGIGAVGLLAYDWRRRMAKA